MRRLASVVAEPGVRDDPFALLGLPARTGLSDEDVHAAWRRLAAATHPDREDGGDPAQFGAAAAAYVTLRTSFGRGEALADLRDSAAAESPGRPGRHRGQRGPMRRGANRRASVSADFRDGAILAGRGVWRRSVALASGIVAGRPGWGLIVRAVVAAAASTAAFLAAGWSPGTAGVFAGALSWLLIAGLRP